MSKPLTMREACDYLAVTPTKFHQLIDAGEVVPFILNGKQVIAQDELDRYVRDQKTDALGRRTIREGGQG